MYIIKRNLPSQFGNFVEGTRVPLTSVPKAVVESWLSSGLIEKTQLPEMPIPEVSPPLPPPPDTKRTTYERKRN